MTDRVEVVSTVLLALAAAATAWSSYRLAAEREAKQPGAPAEPSAATVRYDIQRASDCVLGVVLFAVSLFFAGASAELSVARLRHVTIAVGCVTFVATAIWITTFPESAGV